MEHFAQDHGLNVFRLPVAWQYLTNNDVGSTLNEQNLGLYDQLVQGCLGTGALCIVDVRVSVSYISMGNADFPTRYRGYRFTTVRRTDSIFLKAIKGNSANAYNPFRCPMG